MNMSRIGSSSMSENEMGILRSISSRKMKPVTVKHARAPDDDHNWLKYGQKNLAKSKMRRCYYRCSEHKQRNCPARRSMTFNPTNPEQVTIKYSGEHSHDTCPCPKITAISADTQKKRKYMAEDPPFVSEVINEPTSSPKQKSLQTSPCSQSFDRDMTFSSEVNLNAFQYKEREAATKWDDVSLPNGSNERNSKLFSPLSEGDVVQQSHLYSTGVQNCCEIANSNKIEPCRIQQNDVFVKDSGQERPKLGAPPLRTAEFDLGGFLEQYALAIAARKEPFFCDWSERPQRMEMENCKTGQVKGRQDLGRERSLLAPLPSKKPKSSFISTPVGVFFVSKGP